VPNPRITSFQKRTEVAGSLPLERPSVTSKQKKTSVTCPKCGNEQQEPPGAYSTVCKKCRAHFRLDDVKPSAPKLQKANIEQKHVRCFQCGADLEVSVAAASTMCKKCSSHVDLSDYQITHTVSKNFRTFGRLVIEEKGYLLNTDSRVADAVIRGRLIGKLAVERTLEIHPTATIKGSFTAGRLIIPPETHFRWNEPLKLGGAEISGELVASVQSTGTVVLKATARFFGDIQAANLVIEGGAVFVGGANIGHKPSRSSLDD
jgi:cytoskeletal protein CcmA (bactofilin family)/DNA-directed RNA polymerase subunit RPC12/RpoP